MNNSPLPPEIPRLGLDDIHLDLDSIDISGSTLPPLSSTPDGVTEFAQTSSRRQAADIEIRPGLVYVDTSSAEIDARTARETLTSKSLLWDAHHVELGIEWEAFRAISERRVAETGKATKAAAELLGYVDQTAEQLAKTKSEERERVGRRALAAEGFGTAVQIVESHKRVVQASNLSLNRLRADLDGLIAKQNEDITHKQEILDEVEAHEQLKQSHKQRMNELSIEKTSDGTRIDVSNPSDPNGLSDEERELYKVPDALNYKIQAENDPRTTLNPRIEIQSVREYVENRLLPDIDRTIESIKHNKLLEYDDKILPDDAHQIQQKIAEINDMAASMRAAEGSVGNSQMAADEKRHKFEVAHGLAEGVKARLGELELTQQELRRRAELLPEPNTMPTSALMLINQFGDRGEAVVAQLGIEGPKQDALYGSGGQNIERLAISSGGRPSVRSISLGGLAKRIVGQLKPVELADKVLRRDVVSNIETDD